MEKDWYLRLKTTTNLPQFIPTLSEGVFLRRLDKTLDRGTLKSIIRSAGLTVEEFVELLSGKVR